MAQNEDKEAKQREHLDWMRAHPELGKHQSMKRRKAAHDYCGVCMYMVTIAVAGRKPLLGELCGADDEHPMPWVRPSVLGERVTETWSRLPEVFPQVRVLWLQLMPDHVHGILHVTAPLPRPLGHVMSYFKARCTHHWREMSEYGETQSCSASVPLWEKGFNDRILAGKGRLNIWIAYLRENPYRLWVKREHHEWFSVQHITIGSTPVSVMGNQNLLRSPRRVLVQCSRHLSTAEITAEGDRVLSLAAGGAVAVSACISAGEKAVMRRVYEAGWPQIVLVENGFAPLAKPQGKRFQACATGRLLIVAPWEYHGDRRAITREQCMALNELAREICKDDD